MSRPLEGCLGVVGIVSSGFYLVWLEMSLGWLYFLKMVISYDDGQYIMDNMSISVSMDAQHHEG